MSKQYKCITYILVGKYQETKTSQIWKLYDSSK